MPLPFALPSRSRGKWSTPLDYIPPRSNAARLLPLDSFSLSFSHLSDRAASRATVIQREPFSRVNSIKNEPTSIVRFTAPHGYGNAIHRSVAVTPISDGLQ